MARAPLPLYPQTSRRHNAAAWAGKPWPTTTGDRRWPAAAGPCTAALAGRSRCCKLPPRAAYCSWSCKGWRHLLIRRRRRARPTPRGSTDHTRPPPPAAWYGQIQLGGGGKPPTAGWDALLVGGSPRGGCSRAAWRAHGAPASQEVPTLERWCSWQLQYPPDTGGRALRDPLCACVRAG